MVVSETKDSSMEAEQKMNETVTVAESGKSDMEKVGEAMNVIQSSINSLRSQLMKLEQLLPKLITLSA